MSQVFVVDTDKCPLMPCTPRRARLLLNRGKAAVFRRYPFTLILKPCVPVRTQLSLMFEPRPERSIDSTLRLKIDPGSKTTGMAIVNDVTGEIVWAGELTHRGQRIKATLLERRGYRRNRRQRKTRYRAARFLNRTRLEGWLAPSLQSRVENVLTWVERLRRLCPISALSQELVRFDTQLMQNAEISGIEYQQGTLYGTEIREYLLEKWQRCCAYCGKTDTPFEIEHITPKSRGGSDRVSNLTLGCRPCNERKGNQTAEEFGHPEVQVRGRQPLKDAAAVNSTRWALYRRLKAVGVPLEVGTGGRTKFNRTRLGLQKTHWLDAACVGASTPDTLNVSGIRPLWIRAMGHGNRQMSRTDAYGFPKSHRARQKRYFLMQTGDVVKAIVPKGKYQGTWVSRVVVKASGWFDLVIDGKKASVHRKYCTCLWSSDGYMYTMPAVVGTAVSSPQ
jgi:5-methylcytosine-specific restriction endonuclease McrA